MQHKKLGRLPRAYDQRVPHLSSLMAGRRGLLLPPPPAVDRMSRMPAKWGMMGNDRLGDCTCAALGHAVQLTSFVTGREITPPDAAVLQLYEAACGYSAADPSSDQGGNEQQVLSYVHQHGIPDGAGKHDAVRAYVEIDPRSLDDMRRAIDEAGFIYVGADIPETWTSSNTWSAPGPDEQIAGGHAFIVGGYDQEAFYGVSWGEVVTISPAAVTACFEEVYAVLLASWFDKSGATLAGLTAAQLQQAMEGLGG